MTCESPWDDKHMQICCISCNPQWECNPGYLMNYRGECIEEAVCQVQYQRNCPKNSHFEECGNSCAEKQCDNLDQEGRICPQVCEPRCECDEGYARSGAEARYGSKYGSCQSVEDF